VHAVLIAGTGSDDDYLRRSFGPGLGEAGWTLTALSPAAELLAHYHRALDAAADRHGRIVVGGVSIGAVIGLDWALRQHGTGRCAGVLAALPPWTGEPGDSLAALSAQLTADGIDRDGLAATITTMAASSPDWLAAELSRSWRGLADRDLPGQLRAAAALLAPTAGEISALDVPLAVAACPDDPLHPRAVAREWAAAAPRAAVTEVPLAVWGPRPRALGDAALTSWRRLIAAGPALEDAD